MDSNTYLNTDYIGRSHSECVQRTDLHVVLTNAVTHKTVDIVDLEGNICNFPGIEPSEALCAEMNIYKIHPVVTYSATFKACKNGCHLMIWTVRPDGRFWMDSYGFGAEDYEWVDLYAYIDEKGQFTAPFKLHSIGYQKFFQEND